MNKAIRILPALASMLLLGAAPGPKLIGEFDLAQMRELVEDMGYIWVSGYVADDASPRAVIEARDGPKLQIALRSTECTKEGGQWYCTAFQITPANPPFVAAGDLAAYARSLNDSQSFTRVHPNSMTFFNQKTIEPVTYVSLGGGVTAANIQAHIRMYTRLAIGAYGLGETPQGGGAIQTASGLAPGLYSYSMRARTLNNSGTFCIDRSKKDDNLGRIIAQQISGSNGCTGSAPNGSSVSLSCHGSIADSTLGVTTGSTSYRFSGDIILETDGLGGRERVFIEGHANRVGGC